MRKHKRKKLKNPLNQELTDLYSGFTIKNENNIKIASVIDVLNFGSSDILHILPVEFEAISNGKDNSLMVPIIENAIINIDEKEKVIIINEEYKI